MTTLTIGDVEIIALIDGAAGLLLKLGEVFPTIRPEQWEDFYRRYPRAFADTATWHIYYNCYLVRIHDYVCLVDTGVGPGPYMGQLHGKLLDALRAHEINPEDVNTVFLTHAHSDHVGLNLNAAGRPTFPNARYVMDQGEWNFYQQPQVKMSIAPYIDRMLTPLEQCGVLDLLSGEQPLAEELSAIPTPGHSPGHMSLLIHSKGQKALIGGDVFIHPAQVTRLDWCSIFDMDEKELIATRKHLSGWLEAEEIMLAAGHFPHPGFGRIVCKGGCYYWEDV
ncbi:MAG TPA: hypothetical protein DCK85_13305 [Ktedonobacter sp.]|nr:hypothetical protein [Ktedonobacter sp.]